MSEYGKLRGWPIDWDGHKFVYADSRKPTGGNRRPCGHCRLEETEEGHDGCIGTLEGVMNACCGHGDPEEAYVQFSQERRIGGVEALKWLRDKSKRNKNVALKAAARALLDALPDCGCRKPTTTKWLCSDHFHYDEIKALEALL